MHAVMAKNGVLPQRVEMFGPGGQAQLEALQLPTSYMVRIDSLRDLVEIYDRGVDTVEREIHRELSRPRRLSGCPADTGSRQGDRGHLRLLALITPLRTGRQW
jgi:hypothetical protein